MHLELERLQREYGWRPASHQAINLAADSSVTEQPAPGGTVFSNAQWTGLDKLLDGSWWSQTRNHIISETLRADLATSAIWDIGSGSGIVAEFLIKQGFTVIGVEPSPVGSLLANRRGVTTLCAEFGALVLPANSLDAVSMFDVLEHVSDRSAVLNEVFRVLRPGGYLIVSVPALQTLWSQLDESIGHFLRFNKRSIKNELSLAGFTITRMGYFFLLTVLPLLLLRVLPYRLGKRQALATNATLATRGGFLGDLAAWVERHIALRTPLGSSMLAIARKPAG